MAYDNSINRADVAGLIPAEVSYELLDLIPKEGSHVMALSRRLRNMSAYETDMPVLSALATASFADGDTGLAETTEANWENKYLYAKEITSFIPIPKNVLADSRVPIWSEVKPLMITACGIAIDNSILYGTGAPTSGWPTALITGAAAASHYKSIAAFDDIYDAILGESGLFTLIEQDGFGITGSIAALSMRGKLRGCRDANGNPIFNPDPTRAGEYMLDGVPIRFPKTGVGSATYPLIAGEWNQLVYALRQDINFEVFTEGVVQDKSGKIVFNLMQQRMAAIALTMRVGFCLPNPINWVNSNSTTRYPFGYLTA